MPHLTLYCEEYPDAPIEQSFFEIIYQAAKERNREKINAVLPYISVDVNDYIYGAPIRKLAMEGDIEAVNFLRIHYNASYHWAACGYAQGGYFDEVLEVTNSIYYNFKQFHLMLSLASAYAEGGWIEEEKTIMQICPSNQSERKLFLKYFAKGYAIGGYVNEVVRILNLNPAFIEDQEFMEALVESYSYAGNVIETNKILHSSNSLNYFNLIKKTIRGYARKSFIIEVSKLQRVIANPADQFILYSEMICGFASTGQVALVNKILKMFNNNYDLMKLWREAIYGYAKGGYFCEANKIMCFAASNDERKVLQAQMALALAYYGHFNKVSDILSMALNAQERNELLKNISIGYAWTSQTDKMLELHRQASPSEKITILKYTMYGCGGLGQIEVAKALLILAVDATQRSSMLQQLVNGLTKEGFVDLANEVLTLVENNNEKLVLMRWMGDGYACGGYFNEAKQLLDLTANPADRIAVLVDIIAGGLNNHYQDINKFLGLTTEPSERNQLIKKIVTTLESRMVFLRPETMLSTLVNFNPEYQHEIFNEAKKNDDSKKILLTSIKLNQLINKHKINYRQAAAWVEPYLQIWILQGVSLIQKRILLPEIFSLIFTYLSPMLIPEIYEFSNRLSIRIGRQGFFTSSTQFNNSAKYCEQIQNLRAVIMK